MTAEQIKNANAELRAKSPLEIVKWAIVQAKGVPSPKQKPAAGN